MKDVKDWEVGTLYGIPLFHTLDKDQWVDTHASFLYQFENPNVMQQNIWHHLFK